MSSQQTQSSKITKQNPRTNKMTKPSTFKTRTFGPKPLAPKPLAQLVLNPIPIPPQNQISSAGFKMKFKYSLHENIGIDNSFREKTIPVDIWTRKFKVLMRKKDSTKRKNVESQVVKRWSYEEIDILLSYLEDNYEKFQQVKKQNDKIGSKRIGYISDSDEVEKEIKVKRGTRKSRKNEVERERMNKEFQLQVENFEVEKKKWEFVKE
ncbi:hypothetical protein RhiirA4_471799 [Rhizophagus irregularis]|uniref:Uncharacterized protein n=1 Tax=Rhizophagus irregularis TaxID=588596 RepID=A0A2I1H3T2_9GLOM|nr:hypothetical protein RhiirA4_471799 [Rhizophagus irregularis]